MKIFSNEYHSSIPNSSFSVHGGPARFAVNFSEYLVKVGHTWVGLVQANKKDGDPEINTIYTKKNKKIFEFKADPKFFVTITRAKTFRSPKVLLKKEIDVVRALLKQEEPDVVFLNGFSLFAWIIFEAAKQEGIPIAIQHAGIWAKEIRIYSDKFSPAGRRICYWMERETSKYAEANVFLNKFSRDYFAKILRLKKIKGDTIIPLPRPDWIKNAAFLSADNVDVSNLSIGVIARWDRIKNHQAVLNLAKQIKKQGLNWKIKSITKVPGSKFEKEFKVDYKKNVGVVDPMPNTALPKFFKTIDLLIVPSNFDVSPTVVMEALGCGKPVLISPNVGWVSEYVDLGGGDWVVDFNRTKKSLLRIEDLFSRNSWPRLNMISKVLYKKHDPILVYKSYLTLFKSLAV